MDGYKNTQYPHQQELVCPVWFRYQQSYYPTGRISMFQLFDYFDHLKDFEFNFVGI